MPYHVLSKHTEGQKDRREWMDRMMNECLNKQTERKKGRKIERWKEEMEVNEEYETPLTFQADFLHQIFPF